MEPLFLKRTISALAALAFLNLLYGSKYSTHCFWIKKKQVQYSFPKNLRKMSAVLTIPLFLQKSVD